MQYCNLGSSWKFNGCPVKRIAATSLALLFCRNTCALTCTDDAMPFQPRTYAKRVILCVKNQHSCWWEVRRLKFRNPNASCLHIPKKNVYFLTNQPKTFTSVPAWYPGRSSMLGHCIERPSMLLFTDDLITLTCPFKDSIKSFKKKRQHKNEASVRNGEARIFC